jgi:hypothetical protein
VCRRTSFDRWRGCAPVESVQTHSIGLALRTASVCFSAETTQGTLPCAVRLCAVATVFVIPLDVAWSQHFGSSLPCNSFIYNDLGVGNDLRGHVLHDHTRRFS